jgi:hypothetical protein
MAKNLEVSFFARETAIMYLVEKPDLLTIDIISKILDQGSVDRVQKAIASGIAVKPLSPELNNSLDSLKKSVAQKGTNNSYADTSPKP